MGNSKTSKHYASNPKSRERHREYQAEYNKRPDQVKKRVELNAVNRKNHASGKSKVGDGKDVSHTKSGLKLKSASTNRGSKCDSPGDKRARGNGNKKK